MLWTKRELFLLITKAAKSYHENLEDPKVLFVYGVPSEVKKQIEQDAVFVTEHAAERFHERKIKIKDIRNAINTGEIIEQYPDDYPFPSCLICGFDRENRTIHVCMSYEGTSSRIITAYYPDPLRWTDDFKTRKES